MYNKYRVSVVIVAAGKSKRMENKNKQFILLEDKPVLAHTLYNFENNKFIDSIVLVTQEEQKDYCMQNIINRYKIEKLFSIVSGGNERQESVKNGLKALYGNCDIVLIHDGARPFITDDIINKSIENAINFSAATCAVPVKDTIKTIDENFFIEQTLERNKLFSIQTPQSFKFDTIYSAHLNAEKQNYIGTDDAVLVERIGVSVKIFEGSYQNIKITTPEDLYIAKAILQSRKSKN